jgi:hypothetical protein
VIYAHCRRLLPYRRWSSSRIVVNIRLEGISQAPVKPLQTFCGLVTGILLAYGIFYER